MNLKKLGVMALSAVTMMAPCATTVLADETSKSGETTVKYTQTDGGSWDWSVPTGTGTTTDIDLSDGAKTSTLKITSASIPEDKKIVVTAAGQGTDGAFVMTKTDDTTTTYGFSLTYGDAGTAVTPNSTRLLTYKSSDTSEKSTTITFTPNSTKPKVGEYTGKVTFTATLKGLD